MTFQAEFEQKISEVNSYLDKYLSQKDIEIKSILDSMRYSVFAGGKRIRPVLMMAAYELFDGNSKKIMPFACALEMIHTYSLIHDDLPAMDNSDLRRGQKTNHIVYGEALAVLAGDALLNYAFETMLTAKDIEPSKVLEASLYIAKCSGVNGMIGGQVIDIESEDKVIDKDTLYALHTKKTAALIRTALICGAICAGADENDIKKLEEYAINLGLAFQIKDDILDIEGDSKILGKPTGGDKELNKNTYVSLYGLDEAKVLLNKHTESAKKLLASFGERAEFLLGLTDYLLNRNN